MTAGMLVQEPGLLEMATGRSVQDALCEVPLKGRGAEGFAVVRDVRNA